MYFYNVVPYKIGMNSSKEDIKVVLSFVST